MGNQKSKGSAARAADAGTEPAAGAAEPQAQSQPHAGEPPSGQSVSAVGGAGGDSSGNIAPGGPTQLTAALRARLGMGEDEERCVFRAPIRAM